MLHPTPTLTPSGSPLSSGDSDSQVSLTFHHPVRVPVPTDLSHATHVHQAPVVPVASAATGTTGALSNHACSTFSPHQWQPDVCRECGHTRAEHSATAVRRPPMPSHKPPPPPTAAMGRLAAQQLLSNDLFVNTGTHTHGPTSGQSTPRINPLTHGHIPTFHSTQPSHALSALTFEPPSLSPMSPPSKLSQSPNMSAFAAAVAAAAERRKTSRVPPPIPADILARMQQSAAGHGISLQPPSIAPSVSQTVKPPPLPPLNPSRRSFSSNDEKQPSLSAFTTPPRPFVSEPQPSNHDSPIARLADFFLVIGRGRPIIEPPPSSYAVTETKLAIPPPPSFHSVRFQPSVLSQQRYPQELSPGTDAPNVNMFAFPAYHSMLIVPHQRTDLDPSSPLFLASRPRLHTFVLTNANGSKQYGTCLTIFERVSRREKEEIIADIVKSYMTVAEAKLKAIIAKRERSPLLDDSRDEDGSDLESSPSHNHSTSDRDIELSHSHSHSLYNSAPNNHHHHSHKLPTLPNPIQLSVDLHVQLENHTLFQPKCLCILSIWPFLSLFSAFLRALYRASCISQQVNTPVTSPSQLRRVSTSSTSQTSLQSLLSPLIAFPLSFERLILNFVAEIPVPPPGLLKLRLTMPDSTLVSFARPASNRLPLCDSDYRCLFTVLSLDNIVRVWTSLCMEQKTLMVSSSYSLLTTVCECFTSLLFPFHWSAIFMPIVPEAIIDFLHAPVPFLSGIHESIESLPSFVEPEGTIIVYLDRNEVLIPDDVSPTLPTIGDKDHKKLMAHLKRHGNVTSKVERVDVNCSDWAFPHHEDLEIVQFGDGSDGGSDNVPGTPVSSINSGISQSPRSQSPSLSIAASPSHNRSVSVFSLTAMTPSKKNNGTLFNFSPSTGTPQTPMAQSHQSTITSPISSNGRPQSSMGHHSTYPGSPSPALFAPTPTHTGVVAASNTAFNANEIRYAFLRFFVKLMQNYRKFMPVPIISANGVVSEDSQVSVNRGHSNAMDEEDIDDGSAASPSGQSQRKRSEWMNVDGFVANTPASLRPFALGFVQSQMFARFVDDRIAVDLERKQKNQQRLEAELAFLRTLPITHYGSSSERREPAISVLRQLADLGFDRHDARRILLSYPQYWHNNESAVDFVIQLTIQRKQRLQKEEEEREVRGEKKKSLFDLDSDPTIMATHDQIQFFDEAIVAKLNRRASARLSSSNAQSTPFLSDTSSHLFIPFVPAPPSYLDDNDYYFPVLDEDGLPVFPTLEPTRWGARKVSDLVWMDKGTKGKKWEQKMNFKREIIQHKKLEDAAKQRLEHQQAARKDSFVSRLFNKSKTTKDGASDDNSDGSKESIELYVSTEAGLRVEGRRLPVYPPAGIRLHNGQFSNGRSPRSLISPASTVSLTSIPHLTNGSGQWTNVTGSGPRMSPSSSPVSTAVPSNVSLHHRSLSSHPILLSHGPAPASLPVYINSQKGGSKTESNTPVRGMARMLRRERKDSISEISMSQSQSRSQYRAPANNNRRASATFLSHSSNHLGAAKRDQSPSRSKSEVDVVTFHQPAGQSTMCTSPPVHSPPPLPVQSTVTMSRSMPPPLPTNRAPPMMTPPAVPPQQPAALSLRSPPTQKPAKVSIAAALQITHPNLLTQTNKTTIPSDVNNGRGSPVAFVIDQLSPGRLSRSRSSSQQRQYTESTAVACLSPQALSPLTPSSPISPHNHSSLMRKRNKPLPPSPNR